MTMPNIEKVSVLFRQHADLLSEFSQFLPDGSPPHARPGGGGLGGGGTYDGGGPGGGGGGALGGGKGGALSKGGMLGAGGFGAPAGRGGGRGAGVYGAMAGAAGAMGIGPGGLMAAGGLGGAGAKRKLGAGAAGGPGGVRRAQAGGAHEQWGLGVGALALRPGERAHRPLAGGGELFSQCRQRLRPACSQDLAKCLELFTDNVVDADELIELSAELFGTQNADLHAKLCTMLGRSRTVHEPPSLAARNAFAEERAFRSEAPKWMQFGPSYLRCPADWRPGGITFTYRTDHERALINDVYVSTPTGARAHAPRLERARASARAADRPSMTHAHAHALTLTRLHTHTRAYLPLTHDSPLPPARLSRPPLSPTSPPLPQARKTTLSRRSGATSTARPSSAPRTSATSSTPRSRSRAAPASGSPPLTRRF
jgi:hypothetical protein